MRTKWLVLLIALFAALALSGCGSNGGSGGDSTSGDSNLGTDPDGNAYVGAGACTDCHQGLSFSIDLVTEYLASKHVVHSSHINAGSDPSCLECHDPIGDGDTLEPYLDSSNVPAEGLAAVGCENCHGGGGNHFGVGPMPNVNPDYNVCGECHNALPESHIPHHPFADNILDNYLKSAHYAEGEARDSSPCFRCHSDEGFRNYIGTTTGLDADELTARLAGVADLAVASPVQCKTCHDPHSGELRANETTERIRLDTDGDGSSDTTVEPRPVSFSREFNLCTSCHMAFLDATAVVSTDTDTMVEEFEGSFDYVLDTTRPIYHSTSNDRVITDTHFSDGASIVGYNVNAADEKACTICHDPHGATKFEQSFAGGLAEEWGDAEGFHGDYQSEAFLHNFSRAECMECHNGTEFVKVLEGLAPEDLDISETFPQARVVACVACHDLQAMNAVGDFELGELRVVEEFAFPYWKSIFEEYEELFPELELNTVEGLDENALCMTCHSGRASKFDVDNATPQGDETYRFVNIHYRAAGASLFGNIAKGGYEYDGKTYASKFEHVASNDLCVECHNAHSGELFYTSPGFGPTGCDNCHVGATDLTGVRAIRMIASVADYDGDGDTAEGIYGEVDTLKLELEDALLDAGVTIQEGYPYFGNITTIDQLRAAYNLQVASKDPGSWAHNPSYTIQLLVDSLEALGQTTNSSTGNPFVRDDDGHFFASGEAFRHWDLAFDEETGEYEDGSVSPRCNKCHSSEGAASFLANDVPLETYDREYTLGISSGLACEACHSTGTPGSALITPAAVTFPSGAVIDLGDANNLEPRKSHVCMTCHQGRESGLSVQEDIDAGPGPYGFVNIHYYPAAATFFGGEVNGGYQYAGKTYVNRFAHVSSKNECVECHVDEQFNHDFAPVTPVIDSCRCHGNPLNDFTTIRISGTDYDGDGNTAEGIYGEIWDLTSQDATHPADPTSIVGKLYAAMQAYAAGTIGVGIVYDPTSYPYYFTTTGDRYSSFDAKLLSAAYNYQMIQKDSCGYVHNAQYHLQLLIDSIEDLGGDLTGLSRP